METEPKSDLEARLSRTLLDTLIRAGLVLALVLTCYRILAPFISLLLWALIMAVNIFPLHQKLARRMGGKQGRAATILVVAGLSLFMLPCAFLMNSLADSVRGTIQAVQDNTLVIPAPPEAVAKWPLLGDKIYPVWSQASSDLPALIQSLQPKIDNLAKMALGAVASLGGTLLQLMASFLVAGLIMTYADSGGKTGQAIARRLFGESRGARVVTLATATMRAVAVGVIGVAVIQAILLGLALALAGIPASGALAAVTLVLGVLQVPASLVVLPAVAYLWLSGNYATGAAVFYTVLLVLAGAADNVLKPMLLGRGVDAPMPVILLGALGGMASGGILGMFVAATLLALSYELFMEWVSIPVREPLAVADKEPTPGTEEHGAETL